MPNSQPLPTRLRDGVTAIALDPQPLYAGPDDALSLAISLAADERIAVVGEPAIGARKRWWRVLRGGETDLVWVVECSQVLYYLAPIGEAEKTEQV